MKAKWDEYPDFSKEEFDCTHTGDNKMKHEFMEVLQKIRTDYKKPIIINSGYRSPSHPIEAAKNTPGEHTKGMAADIRCNASEAYRLVKLAYKYNIPRIGVNQKGNSRFIHLGMSKEFPQPVMWSY